MFPLKQFSTSISYQMKMVLLGAIGILQFPVQGKAIVTVTAPAYRADISGNTTIQISAPGETTAVAKCWQNDSALGHDTTVATVTLSGGAGSFVFPAASYPHGPLTIRITAGTDTCHLQVYNTGGVSWKEGLAAAPTPPQAQELTLAYSDDFNGTLSISHDGNTTTYGSHTIDYKDFSYIRFRDLEGGSLNPFLTKDTYLRIRATTVAPGPPTPPDPDPNWNPGGTGLICSIGQDKTGFKVRIPFYMECRFSAQRAIGSWPAFWAVSLPNYPNEEYAELDVIEAYGNISNRRYTAGFHNWTSDSARAYSLIMMDGSIPGTANADWSEAAHTYGVKATATTTTFYLDNVAVWSCPTRTEWKTQEFYFYINYAFGGTSGWPVDLTRYGFKSDMYVDWVRVYKGAAELIVDNADTTGVTKTGTWLSSTSVTGFWDVDYLHDDNIDKGKTVRFTPTISATGNYEVFGRWTSGTTRASNVPFDVTHAAGTTYLQANQRLNGGQWVSLGSYGFNAGTSGNILIGTTATNGYVIADAVRFVPLADIIIDNAASTGMTVTGSWVNTTYAPGYWGTDYAHDDNLGKGSKSVRFTPSIATTGSYQVFARWTAATNRASNVPIDIVHAAGTSTVVVNQRLNDAQWFSLGTYTFNAGTSGSALIRTTLTNGYVIADAVRFMQVP